MSPISSLSKSPSPPMPLLAPESLEASEFQPPEPPRASASIPPPFHAKQVARRGNPRLHDSYTRASQGFTHNVDLIQDDRRPDVKTSSRRDRPSRFDQQNYPRFDRDKKRHRSPSYFDYRKRHKYHYQSASSCRTQASATASSSADVLRNLRRSYHVEEPVEQTPPPPFSPELLHPATLTSLIIRLRREAEQISNRLIADFSVGEARSLETVLNLLRNLVSFHLFCYCCFCFPCSFVHPSLFQIW